jgi:quercetin dioxygenase-like cupin family protein
MSDAPNEPPRPDPQPIAASYLEVDVARELEQLHREAGWQSGRNARTLVKYDGLRIVLIALQKGSRIPEHHANGHVSIHAVAGHIQVRAQGRRFDLRGGALLVLGEGVPHDVEALEESALLLTIGSPREKDRSGP